MKKLVLEKDKKEIFITEFNGPRNAAESPNNIGLSFRENGKEKIWITRIGEIFFRRLLSKKEILDSSYGDLFINFYPDKLTIRNKGEDKIIYTIGKKYKEEFTIWFGSNIGYADGAIMDLLSGNDNSEEPIDR